ncbi:OLC1v1030072C1 [Oldenlandia corymbosa var. corymbosa]|uniref:OLC1v1030072C1 n=1 Tax=Oldenlandia corymbosa var. corymbosa TaxID=529605 RepID=A0AAV1CIF6_OLDCO|nr:OLC1v1030072C1 [Oldenlandia corymbosa var. corymbosa]
MDGPVTQLDMGLTLFNEILQIHSFEDLKAVIFLNPNPPVKMKKPNIAFQFACFLLCASLWATSADPQYQDFINCFVNNSSNSAVISTPDTSYYASILNVSIQNLRFTLPNTPKPQLILAPENEAQIQTALSISVDAISKTAWVGAGATLGETYYNIVQANSSLAFPAEQLTAFSLKRTLEQNATDLVYKWQTVAPNLPPELLLELQLTVVPSNQTADGKTIQATFVSLFLGGANDLVSIMNQTFPELGLVRDDCITLPSWVDFLTYFYQRPLNLTDTILTSRLSLNPKSYFKSTADFVQNPIPKQGLEE